MKEFQVSKTLCPHCSRDLDACTSVFNDDAPTPGAITICLYCSAILVFDEKLQLHQLSDQEMDELKKEDPMLYLYVLGLAGVLAKERQERPDTVR